MKERQKMGRRSETTEYLKECIADALINLMEETPIEKIKIQDISALARVGRATYFRNFQSKTDVVVFKIRLLLERWNQDHPLDNEEDIYQGALRFFSFYYSIRRLVKLLYREKLHALIYQAIQQAIPFHSQLSHTEKYFHAFLIYGMLGFVTEWANCEFQESPEELARLFADRF